MEQRAVNIISQRLAEQGFAQIQEMLSAEFCLELKTSITKKLQEFIALHAISEEAYFSTVNRWPLQALISVEQLTRFIQLILSQVCEISGLRVKPFEIDVLYKSPFANRPTPCHQDISYAYKQPYLLSTWIALTEVNHNESALQFLPESHHYSIMPAIDFWQPGFIDSFRHTLEWQQQAVTVTANIGDAIIFSSKIWHGSLSHQASEARFAIVVRWGNDEIISEQIPLPEKNIFGMWNCGEYTKNLLQKGLKAIYNLELTDFTTIIRTWLNQTDLPFQLNMRAAHLALEKLLLLNEAYQYYEGGDGQGIIYPAIWHSLLVPLKNYLNE